MPAYVPIEDARSMRGLRLVLTAFPGPPWTEAAKAVFHVKRIPYAPVAQQPMVTNDALQTWTGHSNAPIAVYGDERPRAGWAEILVLAERLAPEPRLIPADLEDRVRLFGLANEICGEDGLGWNRRLLMIAGASEKESRGGLSTGVADYLASRYQYSEAAARRAPARIQEIVRALQAQLHAQRARGRRFLIGDSLSALDLYWAAFAALIEPLAPDLCPMPDFLRAIYTFDAALRREIADLLAHRDRIYRDHLELPVVA
jgi:glutathione S-transferase